MTTLGLLKDLRMSQNWEELERGHRYKFRNKSAEFFISFTVSTDPREKVYFESQYASMTVEAHIIDAVVDHGAVHYSINKSAAPFFKFYALNGREEITKITDNLIEETVYC